MRLISLAKLSPASSNATMFLPITMILLTLACFVGLVVFILVTQSQIKGLLALIRQYPDALITLDKNSKLIACNQAFADLLGYGSIRECLAFFEEYPHFSRDDYQLIKAAVENSEQGQLRLDKVFTLTQRMGGKVEREIELFRRTSKNRTELRFLPPQVIAQPDDLWSKLLSSFEIPVILQDNQGRLVSTNTAAKSVLNLKIGDQFTAESATEKKWIQVPLTGHANHRLALLMANQDLTNVDTSEQTGTPLDKHGSFRSETSQNERAKDETAELDSDKQESENQSTQNNSPESDDDISGTWSINFEDGKLEQSHEIVNLLGYSGIKDGMSVEFLWNCIANTDKPRIIETYEDYEAGRSSELRATFRVADRRGAEHYVEIRGHATERGHQGQLLKLVGTHRLLTPTRNKTAQEVRGQAPTISNPSSGFEGKKSQTIISSKVVQHDLANHLGVVTGYADLLLADPTLSAETKSFVEAIATAGNEAQDNIREQNKIDSRKFSSPGTHSDPEEWTLQFNEGLDRLTQILTTYFDAEATREGKTETRDYIVETNPDYCGVCGEQIELGSHAREVFDSRVRINHQSLPYVTNPAFLWCFQKTDHITWLN